MLKQTLVRLNGYETLADKFDELLNQYSAFEIDFISPDFSLFFQRLIPVLSQCSAAQAYEILLSLKQFSMTGNRAADRAAYGLLDTCPFELVPFLNIAEEKCESEAVIDIRNIATELAAEKREQSQAIIIESDVSQEEQAKDRPRLKLLKRLYQANIHIDAIGKIYILHERKPAGEPTVILNGGGVNIVPLDESSINLDIIQTYIKFSQNLLKVLQEEKIAPEISAPNESRHENKNYTQFEETPSFSRMSMMELRPCEIPQVNFGDYAQECKIIREKHYSQDVIRQAALSSLEKYEKDNLLPATDSLMTAKRFVPQARAMAFIKLRSALLTDDNRWNKFKELYNCPAFRKEAGYYASGTLNALTIKLSVPFTLWRKVESIANEIRKKKIFFAKFNDRNLLTRVLSDDELYNNLSKEDLECIFDVCDRDLFLELVVKHGRLNGWKNINVSNCEIKLDASRIQKMTNYAESNLHTTNKLRHKFNVSQKLPANYLLPGISENVENWPKELLYQFEGPDIATAENFLLEKYSHLFINKFETPPKSTGVINFLKEKFTNLFFSKVEAVPMSNSAIQFFYIPVAMHPILTDNPNSSHSLYRDFMRFSKALRGLVNEYKNSGNAKPQVFCGISSLDGVHYVPYFIYKNPDDFIQVITVNPSPQMKSWDTEFSSDDSCPKFNSYEKLRNIFSDIFPGCEFSDPNVTQQLRQRDCGPNSLTVLEDAFRLAESEQSLIEIKDQCLRINSELLSVNFNPLRVMNFESGQYYYSPLATLFGQQNRDVWAGRLRQFSNARYIMFGDQDLHLNTPFIFAALQEYSYGYNVARQSVDDQVSEVYSQVAGAIIASSNVRNDIDAVRAKFIESLSLPNEVIINKYVDGIKKDYPEIMQNARQHNDDLNNIVKCILENNVRDIYDQAIINYFDRFISGYRLENPAVSADNIINSYLMFSKASEYFVKLSAIEKNNVFVSLRVKVQKVYAAMVDAALREHFHQSLSVFYVRATFKDLCSLFISDERMQAACVELMLPYEANFEILALFKTSLAEKLKLDMAAAYNIILKNYYLAELDFENIQQVYSNNTLGEIVRDLLKPEVLSAQDQHELSKLSASVVIIDGFTRVYGANILQHLIDKNTRLAALKNFYLIHIRFMQEAVDLQKNYQIRADVMVEIGLTLLMTEIKNKFAVKLDELNGCYRQSDDFTAVVAQLVVGNVETEMRKFLVKFMENYRHADINLSGFTVRARQFLSLAFAIHTNDSLPRYFTSAMAAETDLKIKNRIAENFSSYSPVNMQFAMRPLCYIKAKTEVPACYGKPVTPQLLCQIAMNWAKSYDENLNSGRDFPSRELKILFSALNNLPVNQEDNAGLSKQWLDENIKNIFSNINFLQASNEEKIAKLFIAALSSTASLSAHAHQAVPENDKIRLSHLNDVLALYKNAKRSESIAEYVCATQYPTALMCPTDKIVATLQRGSRKSLFNTVSADVANIEKTLQAIMERHQAHGDDDFALDKQDIKWITKLLEQRWKELCLKSASPRNYVSFDNATDRIYLLLALIVKAALKNFEVEITAYQLLMPGKVRNGIREIDENEENLLENDIDSYNYKDIIILPDKRWLSVKQFVYDYNSSHVLRDSFTKAVLSRSDVQHILNNYPEVAETILQIFTSRCYSVFTVEIKNACLEYIRNSVFAGGFRGYYTGVQNVLAQAAFDKFIRFISNLPDARRAALLALKIPPAGNVTLEDVLYKNDRDACITYAGLAVAKLVWQSCPDVTLADFGDGLKNRAVDFQAITRNSIVDLTEIPENEQPLSDYVLSRNSRRALR